MNFDHLAQIKHRVWDGAVNIRVVLEYSLNTSSSETSASPPPTHLSSLSSVSSPVLLTLSLVVVKEFLISVYRNSYVPTFLPLMVEYFSSYVDELAKIPTWLEWNDIPLKWNLPVGVLYDVLTLSQRTHKKDDDSNVWTLHLRYKDQYPRTTVIPFVYTTVDGTVDYAKSLHELIVNQLKQSCFVMNGSAKPMLNLSKEDSTKLWEAIQNHNLAHYNQVNRRITPRDSSLVLKIPIKIYMPGFAQVIQHPISTVNAEGALTTLKEVLEANIPRMELLQNPLTVLIHGIAVQEMLDTPAIQYWELFSYLDNFLHVVIF